MPAPVVASGSIFASRAGLGPNNNEFVVDGSTGQVDFKIGTPSATSAAAFPALAAPTFSGALTGTGLATTTKNTDAFQQIDRWIGTYMLDSPPVPTLVGSSKDTQKISVQFTMPPQKRLGFAATAVPFIKYVRADVVQTSLNGAGDWSHASTIAIVMETPAGSAFASANTLELYVDAGTNALVSTVYKRYGILSETPYDIRIYGSNESGEAIKAITVMNIATDPVGTPVAPTSLGATPSASPTPDIATSWTKPIDHDTNTPGNQTTPFVTRYKVSRSATSSVRYGGVIADTADSFTTETSGANAATSLNLATLNPGTLYSVTVAAKNAINASYGAATSAVTATTSYPTAPTYLGASDATALNAFSGLQSPYPTTGGYQMDGTTAATPILNYSLLSNTNVRTTSATARRTNLVEGATGTVGTLIAYAGPTATYTDAANQATFNAQGLGTTSASSSSTSSSGRAALYWSGDSDKYAAGATNQQGFYKQLDCYAAVNDKTLFPGSSSSYSLRMQYTPAGGSAAQSAQVTFFVDDATTATSVSNVGIIGETLNAVTRISGVPTYTSSATFRAQFVQAEIAHYFLTFSKKHSDIVIVNSSGTAISSVVTVNPAAMGATHKYYTAPTPGYTTSSTLHNTSGLQLIATSTPENIQFNTFTLQLTGGSNLFDENLQVKVTPYSLVSNTGGTPATGTYLNPSTGATRALRIDTVSVTADRSAGSKAATATGQHVTSGSGTYPSTGYGTGFDHTATIVGTEELQLVNGVYASPAVGTGYRAYSNLFYTSAGLTLPDYSSITSATSAVRWVTFRYTGRIASSTYTNIRLTVAHSGLTVNYGGVDQANHKMQIKVEDASLPTGWMDCTNAVSPLGIGSGPDGTACVVPDFSSASQRDCIVRAGTGASASFLVRVGIPCNIAASVTSVTVTPLVAFS
jgi:hypothetical protein